MAVLEDRTPVVDAPAGRARAHSTPGGNPIWLSTPEWLLVPVTPAHAPLFARLHARNAEHFLSAMNIVPEMCEAEYWQPILQHQQNEFLAGTGLFLIGFHKACPRTEIGCVISFAGIVHDEFQACWLGYRLDRSLQGLGLMYAAVAPAVKAVFEHYGLHRIMASHQPENLRSALLLRRLGFNIEGYSRDYMFSNGQWRDNVLLALLEPGA